MSIKEKILKLYEEDFSFIEGYREWQELVDKASAKQLEIENYLISLKNELDESEDDLEEDDYEELEDILSDYLWSFARDTNQEWDGSSFWEQSNC